MDPDTILLDEHFDDDPEMDEVVESATQSPEWEKEDDNED